MAQIQFVLNKQKQDKFGAHPIVMHVTFNSERVRKATKEKTLPNHWNEKRQRVREPKKSDPYNNFDFINSAWIKLYQKAKGYCESSFL